ncbi:MAG: DinB family protein [Frankiaceae bacterium]
MTNDPDRQVAPLVLGSIDYVWSRVRDRLGGLDQDEYLWEPAPGCWSVREHDGAWLADLARPEPVPPPVTTIAWRLWHIASDCLAGYTSAGLGPWPLEVRDAEWFGEVGQALPAADAAWSAFRSGLERLGEDGMWRALGPGWGAYADDSWAALVLHAQDEISHHGAEIALLRDLHAAQRTTTPS